MANTENSTKSITYVTGLKVIFLDIDGVLNSAEWFAAAQDVRSGLSRIDKLQEMIEPRAVELLNDLLARTGATVVLSSSWRISYGMGFIGRALMKRGFTGRIRHRTPVIGSPRGREIQAWLDSSEEKPETFVILDDNSDMAHLSHRLVQTTWGSGLQAEHVERAVEMLGA
jgi:Swiss Army Knife RNA repair-like protein